MTNNTLTISTYASADSIWKNYSEVHATLLFLEIEKIDLEKFQGFKSGQDFSGPDAKKINYIYNILKNKNLKHIEFDGCKFPADDSIHRIMEESGSLESIKVIMDHTPYIGRNTTKFTPTAIDFVSRLGDCNRFRTIRLEHKFTPKGNKTEAPYMDDYVASMADMIGKSSARRLFVAFDDFCLKGIPSIHRLERALGENTSLEEVGIKYLVDKEKDKDHLKYFINAFAKNGSIKKMTIESRNPFAFLSEINDVIYNKKIETLQMRGKKASSNDQEALNNFSDTLRSKDISIILKDFSQVSNNILDIAKDVKKSFTLESVKLNHTSVAHLSEVLIEKSYIKEIKFHKIKFGGKEGAVKDKFHRLLLNTIKRSDAPERLSLEENSISNAQVIDLLKEIYSNSSRIKYLNLSENPIGDDAVEEMAAILNKIGERITTGGAEFTLDVNQSYCGGISAKKAYELMSAMPKGVEIKGLEEERDAYEMQWNRRGDSIASLTRSPSPMALEENMGDNVRHHGRALSVESVQLYNYAIDNHIEDTESTLHSDSNLSAMFSRNLNISSEQDKEKENNFNSYQTFVNKFQDIDSDVLKRFSGTAKVQKTLENRSKNNFVNVCIDYLYNIAATRHKKTTGGVSPDVTQQNQLTEDINKLFGCILTNIPAAVKSAELGAAVSLLTRQPQSKAFRTFNYVGQAFSPLPIPGGSAVTTPLKTILGRVDGYHQGKKMVQATRTLYGDNVNEGDANVWLLGVAIAFCMSLHCIDEDKIKLEKSLHYINKFSNCIGEQTFTSKLFPQKLLECLVPILTTGQKEFMPDSISSFTAPMSGGRGRKDGAAAAMSLICRFQNFLTVYNIDPEKWASLSFADIVKEENNEQWKNKINQLIDFDKMNVADLNAVHEHVEEVERDVYSLKHKTDVLEERLEGADNLVASALDYCGELEDEILDQNDKILNQQEQITQLQCQVEELTTLCYKIQQQQQLTGPVTNELQQTEFYQSNWSRRLRTHSLSSQGLERRQNEGDDNQISGYKRQRQRTDEESRQK